MQQQIVHDAEVHRQHVRLKIPIGVEIDGARYTVDDWSLGGFGVAGTITSRQPGERFPLRLIFPFEDFEVSMRLDGQMVYATPESDRFGCKFLALSEGQLSLFRYLVDAYLSGEIVRGGEILAVAGRDNTADARMQQIFNPFNEEVSSGRRWRRRIGLFLLMLAGVALAGVVGLGYQERFLVTETDAAVVDAPVFRVETLSPGTVVPMTDQQTILRPGDPVARIEAPERPPVTLVSPCECVVHEWVMSRGQVAQSGALIAVLVSTDRPLVIRAELTPEQAEDLRVGQVAEITLLGRPETYRGQIETVDARIPLVPGESLSGRRHRVVVVLRPDTPLNFDDLGHIARVRIF